MAIGVVGAQAQVADPVRPVLKSPPVYERNERGSADKVVPRILNDTRAYCEELRADIARIRLLRQDIPDDAEMLTREGERLCRIGHIRPGVYRLRTALMILRQGQ